MCFSNIKIKFALQIKNPYKPTPCNFRKIRAEQFQCFMLIFKMTFLSCKMSLSSIFTIYDLHSLISIIGLERRIENS